jgi:hypothetical protein
MCKILKMISQTLCIIWTVVNMSGREPQIGLNMTTVLLAEASEEAAICNSKPTAVRNPQLLLIK